MFGNSNEIMTEASDAEEEGLTKWQRIEEIDEQLARHTALEGELKTLKANIREAEKQKDELVAAARAKITEAEAKVLISGAVPAAADRAVRRLPAAVPAGLHRRRREPVEQVRRHDEADSCRAGSGSGPTQRFLKELGYE